MHYPSGFSRAFAEADGPLVGMEKTGKKEALAEKEGLCVYAVQQRQLQARPRRRRQAKSPGAGRER